MCSELQLYSAELESFKYYVVMVSHGSSGGPPGSHQRQQYLGRETDYGRNSVPE